METDLNQKIDNANRTAMMSLKENSTELALSKLRYAESLLINHKVPKKSRLWSTTLNNFGSYYKRLGNHTRAMEYFNRALKTESAAGQAVAQLNMCAVKSLSKDHYSALQHALVAYNLLSGKSKKTNDQMINFVTSINSIGQQFSALGLSKSAMKYLKEAWELSCQVLGDCEVTEKLKHSYFEILSNSQRNNGFFPLAKRKNKDLIRNNSLQSRQNSHRFKQLRPRDYEYPDLFKKKYQYLTMDRVQPIDRYTDLTKRYTHKQRASSGTRSEIKNIKPSSMDIVNQSQELRKTKKTAKNLQKERNNIKKKRQPLNKSIDETLHKSKDKMLRNSKGTRRREKERLAPIEVKYNIDFKEKFHVKGHRFREFLEFRNRAAVTIQKWVRKYQAQRLYNSIREAVLFIQYQFRI